jgi:hypothetical protein
LVFKFAQTQKIFFLCVFQWLNSNGGAVLLVNDVPQAMLSFPTCDLIVGSNMIDWLPVYDRIQPYHGAIISAADGTVGIQ